jgi:hypothetical protein
MKKLTVVLLAVQMFPVSASDLFVALDGDDVNGLGTINQPWKTPQRAYLAASCGDTVWIRSGHYNNANGVVSDKNRFVYSSYPQLAQVGNGAGCAKNEPLTIRGWDGVNLGVPGHDDRPVLYGSDVIGNLSGGPSGWTGPDASGVYRITLNQSFPNPRTVAVEKNPQGDVRLTQRPATVTLQPGEYTYINNTSGVFLRYRPSDDHFDNEIVFLPRQTSLFEASGRDSVRIMDLRMEGAINSRNQGMITLSAASLESTVEHWHIERVGIRHAAFHGILLRGANQNLITGGSVESTGYGGVYIKAANYAPYECTDEWSSQNGNILPETLPKCLPTSSHNVVESMRVTDVAHLVGEGDQCAICVGGLGINANNHILNNQVYSTGNLANPHGDAAIAIWHGEDTLVYGNFVKNHVGTGIQVATKSHRSVIANNIVYKNGFAADGSPSGHGDPRGGIEVKFSDDLLVQCNLIYGNRSGGSRDSAPRGGLGVGQPTDNASNPQHNLNIFHNIIWGNRSGGFEPIDDAQMVFDGWTEEYAGAYIDFNYINAENRIVFDGRNDSSREGIPIDVMHDAFDDYIAATGYDSNGGPDSFVSTTDFCFNGLMIDTDGDGIKDFMEARLGTDPTVFDLDADGDGYPSTLDCNDNDPTVYPGAPEILNDGIDQSCNGYDLTIGIRSIELKGSRNYSLTVVATSMLGENAALVLEGYGPMAYNPRKDEWVARINKIEAAPQDVTVTGVEGSVVAAVPTGRLGDGSKARSFRRGRNHSFQ